MSIVALSKHDLTSSKKSIYILALVVNLKVVYVVMWAIFAISYNILRALTLC